MVAVAESEDEEVAEPRFGVSDIREGWVAPDLGAEADPVPEHAVEGPGVFAGVGCGGGLESKAEVSCVCVKGGRCSRRQPPGCG